MDRAARVRTTARRAGQSTRRQRAKAERRTRGGDDEKGGLDRVDHPGQAGRDAVEEQDGPCEEQKGPVPPRRQPVRAEPRQSVPQDKIKQPGREDQPEVREGGNPAKVRQHAPALRQQRGQEGPDHGACWVPLYPAGQQGIEQVELQQDGDKVEVGGGLAGEDRFHHPKGVPAAGRQVGQMKVHVRQGVDPRPQQIGRQGLQRFLFPERTPGRRAPGQPQGEAGEQEEHGNGKPGGLVEEKGQIHPQDQNPALTVEIGAGHMDGDDRQHGQASQEIDFRETRGAAGRSVWFHGGHPLIHTIVSPAD